MDLKRLQATLEARYESNPEDRRALKVLRRVRKTIDKRERAARRSSPKVQQADEKRAAKLLASLIEAIDSGKRIVALDAEWSRDGSRAITEIGLAIYEAGQLTVRNIRVTPDYLPTKDNFLGQTEHLSPEEADAALREVLDSADLLSGHALRNDRLQFQRWRNLPIRDDRVFDTQVYGKAAYATILSLRDLMRKLDITPKGVHSAGNDAYYVIMALLALAGRIEECRALGARPIDPRRDARMERVREKAKQRIKTERIEERSPEERARAQMPSLSRESITVGTVYLGRRFEDWPRRVERIEQVDAPRAPSGKQTIVVYRKIGGSSEKTLTLTNFAHWAIEVKE